MSNNPHGASEIHGSKGGGPAKWLLGGLAAVVLLGGGYYAWTNFSPSQANSESAYNDPYADTYAEAPLRAGPVESDQEPLAQSAPSDDTVAAPASTPTRATTPTHRAPVRTAAVPEETFGITPISATQGEDDIIVTAPRRPIWARTPSARRLSELYPARALERGREGERGSTARC